MSFTVGDGRHSKMLMFLLRELQINPQKKIQDPAGIQAQHLPNTSPLGPLAEEQKTSYISSIA